MIGEMSGEYVIGSYNWISLSNRHIISYHIDLFMVYAYNTNSRGHFTMRQDVIVGLYNYITKFTTQPVDPKIC